MTKSESRYFNRELSWIEFNQRVLDEARDTEIPLLERLKFLAITASNLDEFFMVRVGGLSLQRQSEPTRRDPSGMTGDEQLAAILERTHQMTADQYACLGQLEASLEEEGIKRLTGSGFSERQTKVLEELFDKEISAIYTPFAVADQDDFPPLTNQTMNVCVLLKPDDTEDGEQRFAIIPFGRSAQRVFTLHSEGGYAYTLLEDVVGLFAERFFPGAQVVECAPFRITRNADVSMNDEVAADLLVGMEEILDARRNGDCVRLEITDTTGEVMRNFLTESLEVDERDVFSVPGPLDLSAFMQLTDLAGFDEIKYEPWPPLPSPEVDRTISMFDTISQKDVLLTHPYESFEPVVRLLEEAADDPDVLAIKQTLYRTSKNSPIIAALQRAAERGKYVTAIVELKARFDEARNIEWAKDLTRASVQVFYGVKGLKTHSKVCIIVRREPHGIQRYVHFGTGNYNETTARIYSDVSYMTCDEELAADATSFFNAITGYSQPHDFRRIEAAPLNLRERVLEMIEAETVRKQQGQQAYITAKINSLVDPQIINSLYAASQAGVIIRLNIRGICCLRPGVPGMSENITVLSIIDRFLEHARLFAFYHGGDERVFISSADWMPRNLDRRVELLVPIDDEHCKRRLMDQLDIYFRDNVKAQRLLADGTYQRVNQGRRQTVRSQEELYQQTLNAVNDAEQRRRTVFEPHHSPESKIT